MKIAAIIAEYNPFHNGHKYQIEETKRITGCDCIVAVMSGDFVQRGEPAIADKVLRTRCALENGIDAVFELPVGISTASAEEFASGAVSLLNSLGCIDYLCFGSEWGDLSLLSSLAEILTSEPASYTASLKDHLKKGLPYPAARVKALCHLLYEEADKAYHSACNSLPKNKDDFSDFLQQPNNILAIEYLKALKESKSFIKPITISRMGTGYHDLDYVDGFCSASALRAMLKSAAATEALKGPVDPLVSLCVPQSAIQYLRQEYGHSLPIFLEDFSLLLHYALLRIKKPEELCSYQGISEDLAKRIFSLIPQYQDYASFLSLIKARNYTEAALRRALLHILLSLPLRNEPAYFARLLGFRKDTLLLSEIKKSSRIPVLSKPADACFVLKNHYSEDAAALSHALSQFTETVNASDIWHAVSMNKFGTSPYCEYRQSPIIV